MDLRYPPDVVSPPSIDLDSQLIDELARVFNDERNARVVVLRAGFPPARVPAFHNALTFWTAVINEARAGVLEGGVAALARQAHAQFSGNATFANYDEAAGPGDSTRRPPRARPARALPQTTRPSIDPANPAVAVGSMGVYGGRGVGLLEPEASLWPTPRSTVPAEFGRKEFAGREAEFERLDEVFADTSAPAVVVLSGPPGHGKSHLAMRYAHERASRYPGGTYLVRLGRSGPPDDLLLVGGNAVPALGSLDERCQWVLANLGREATLVVYDNVVDVRYLERWGPVQRQKLHVVVTTTRDFAEQSWPVCPVGVLPDDDAETLTRELLGDALFGKHGVSLVASAQGLPLELVMGAGAVRSAERRGHPVVVGPTHADTEARFEQAWSLLEMPEAQRALQLCAMYEATRVPLVEVRQWLGESAKSALDGCFDHLLIDPAGRMHGLFGAFVRRRHPASEDDRRRHMEAFLEAADAVADRPSDEAAVDRLSRYPAQVSLWGEIAGGLSERLWDGVHRVGDALYELGRFEEALGWYERAVEHKERGDVHGRIDHSELGKSLHCVGFCLLQQGQYERARGWYERAVEHKERGDVHGRVDHSELGKSLHCVGVCLSQQGQYEQALEWYERAVEHKERGDVHDRVEHSELGKSLHCVGLCLSQQGQYEQARGGYERAVEHKERGDFHGRVDHSSVGKSLHQVGMCLSRQRQYEQARRWYERAVEHKERGDVHGRVNHESLSKSLHEVGFCLSQRKQYEQARGWYERGVEHTERGDVHGRVDHESLGMSLHQVGLCLSLQRQYEQARGWYERAVEHKERGDVHGRVDHSSLGKSLHCVGFCLSQQGQYEQACGWYERSVEHAERGDVHGRVDHKALGKSLRQVGVCLSEQGQHEQAKAWYERSDQAKQRTNT